MSPGDNSRERVATSFQTMKFWQFYPDGISPGMNGWGSAAEAVNDLLRWAQTAFIDEREVSPGTLKVVGELVMQGFTGSRGYEVRLYPLTSLRVVLPKKETSP